MRPALSCLQSDGMTAMTSGLESNELSAGMRLPELRKLITQQQINLYAKASQDFNPIHINEEFARQTPLGGTVAHGMLILSYISELMTANFGKSWLTSGKLSARFKAPARPGDTITVAGKITRVQKEDGYLSIDCDILCQNQRNETVIASETKVSVPV